MAGAVESQLQQALFPAAQQGRTDETRAEAAVDVLHALKHRQGHLGGVGKLGGLQAVAARAAVLRRRFAKVAEDVGAQALVGLTVGGHLVEALPRGAAGGGERLAVQIALLPHSVDEKALGGDVALAKEQHAVRRLAVAPGAASLLIVAFEVLGHVEVDDKAHVRLVDAHAKGVGGHHHQCAVIGEVLLIFAPLGVGKAGVVARGGDAAQAQLAADLFDRLAGGAVDDAALAFVAGERAKQRLHPVAGPLDEKAQVGAVEARHQRKRLAQAQQALYVAAHALGGRGREGAQARARGKGFEKLGNVQIAGAEILPPLGNAVRLVHGDHGDGQRAAQAQKARREQALRGDVDQLVLSGGEVSKGDVHLPLGERAVEKRRRHARLLERRHLILHQRDERRDHQRAARQSQRRHLIADGLARPGGHHAQHVAAGEDGVDDFALTFAEGVVAKDALQHIFGRFAGLGAGGRGSGGGHFRHFRRGRGKKRLLRRRFRQRRFVRDGRKARHGLSLHLGGGVP